VRRMYKVRVRNSKKGYENDIVRDNILKEPENDITRVRMIK